MILVIGGTGTVGSQVVTRLLSKGIKVRVMTRSKDKISEDISNLSYVLGDLSEPHSLSSVFQGVDRLCLITPLSPSEAEEGKRAVQEASQAEVEKVVFMSVHQVDRAPHIPHFRSKIEIREELERINLDFVEIMPNNFFQNDLWGKDVITEHGIYPQPIGEIGLSRVDVRDIADAIVIALLEEGFSGKQFPLAGLDVVTGTDAAQTWSETLGQEVVYGGDDLDTWARQAGEMMPQWLVDDLKIMYQFFQKEGLRASKEDLRAQADLLKREPRSYSSFVKEIVAAED